MWPNYSLNLCYIKRWEQYIEASGGHENNGVIRIKRTHQTCMAESAMFGIGCILLWYQPHHYREVPNKILQSCRAVLNQILEIMLRVLPGPGAVTCQCQQSGNCWHRAWTAPGLIPNQGLVLTIRWLWKSLSNDCQKAGLRPGAVQGLGLHKADCQFQPQTVQGLLSLGTLKLVPQSPARARVVSDPQCPVAPQRPCPSALFTRRL